jgi:hypothetical protein
MQIGVLTGLMDGVTGAALVCAGLASVILFPVAALALLRTSQRARPAPHVASMQGS